MLAQAFVAGGVGGGCLESRRLVGSLSASGHVMCRCAFTTATVVSSETTGIRQDQRFAEHQTTIRVLE